MDADGLKWTSYRTKMTRRHVGFGAGNGVRLSHKRKPFTAFVSTLILNSGDISTNPGPRCLCNLCKKRVKDPGIQCDVCNKWLHPKCVGLDETEYLRLGCNERNDLEKDFSSALQPEINIRGLKVAHINCHGLLGKLTCLSDKIKDEAIRIDGYNVQRLDLPNQLLELKSFVKSSHLN